MNKLQFDGGDYMTELEKIIYAKSFIDKLANGINPLDDTHIPEEDVVNNVRLSRCFFYVSDILDKVIENGGIQPVKARKARKKQFIITDGERSKIQISEIPLSSKEISKRLNGLIDLETTKKISAITINNWLLDLQLLEIVVLPNGKNRKMPTEQGRELGIFTEERIGQYGTYVTVLFDKSAQQFIYDNIEAIVGSKNEKDNPFSEFCGRPWTETYDECLVDLFKKNISVSEIAVTLKRTEGGIRARLKKLGLIENRRDAN